MGQLMIGADDWWFSGMFFFYTISPLLPPKIHFLLYPLPWIMRSVVCSGWSSHLLILRFSLRLLIHPTADSLEQCCLVYIHQKIE